MTVFATRIHRSLLQHVHIPGCSSPFPYALLFSARSRRQIWSLFENRVLSSAQAFRRHLAACVVLGGSLCFAQRLALRDSDSVAVACRRSVCIVQKNMSHCQHRFLRRHALSRTSIPPSFPARRYPQLRSRPHEDAAARSDSQKTPRTTGIVFRSRSQMQCTQPCPVVSNACTAQRRRKMGPKMGLRFSSGKLEVTVKVARESESQTGQSKKMHEPSERNGAESLVGSG